MEKKYLYNRDNAKLWFEPTETENEYILNVDEDHKYVLEYACINYNEVPDDAEIFDFESDGQKGIFHSFDPAGGPYICLGYETNLGVVKRIYEKNDQLVFIIK
jgi:hypothetical protein